MSEYLSHLSNLPHIILDPLTLLNSLRHHLQSLASFFEPLLDPIECLSLEIPK